MLDIDFKKRKEEWLGTIAPESQFYQLFDYFQDVSFFAKDAEGYLQAANKAFIARFDLKDESCLLGL